MTTIHQVGFDHTGPRRTGRFVQANPSLQYPDPLKFLPLWPHQARFLKELQDEQYWFIVGPPAAGKSLTIAALLTHKLDRDPTLRAIIAVPQTIIGNGFEDSRFQMSGYPEAKQDISFNPGAKLHKPSHDSNAGQVKRFLNKPRTSPVNDRVLICTHQTLVAAHKKFPKLFQDVLVVVDEAHHSKAEETPEGDTLANELGRVVLSLVETEQPVGLATATVARADGCGLLGPHQDKFKVAECPFDKYLEVCQDFKHFDFGFTLYDQDAWEPIDELLGDKRKRIPCTIAHIPHVNSSCSRGKRRDQLQVYRGIAGQPKGRLKIKNPDGNVTGITEIQRGRHTVRVVDLVNTKNSTLKQQVIQQAHDDPDNSRIDVILALRKFIEGANWRWAQNSLILGHRGSFTEMAQLVGRGLRDAPGKQSCSIHYILQQRGTAPDGTPEILNDYLKALLFVLLLEDVLQPVKIRVRDPKTGKRRTVKTCLLTEALNHDLTEKFRIEELVIEELSSDVDHTDKTAVRVVAALLEQEQVWHPWASTNDIARQIIKTYRRRSKSLQVTERLQRATVGSDVQGVDVNLVEESNHPLAWVTYFTQGIGISTLVGLRKALQSRNEAAWQWMFGLLPRFVAEQGRFPRGKELYHKCGLGAWCITQRALHKKKNLSKRRTDLLASLDGWCWDKLASRWISTAQEYRCFVNQGHGSPRYHCDDPHEARLGRWGAVQRYVYHKRETTRNLSKEQIEFLESLVGWSWTPSNTGWFIKGHECQAFVARYGKYPTCGGNEDEAILARWVRTQRGKKQRGKKLSKDQLNFLENIDGWSWDVYASKFNNQAEAILAYVNTHGEAPVAGTVGSWWRLQKTNRKKNCRSLTPKRLAMLYRIEKVISGATKLKTAPLTRYTTTNKLQARHDTIVDLYRSAFGRKSLPKAKQFWSMSARCCDDAGELLPGSELHQLLETKLIRPDQFHGVDNDEAIWEANGFYEEANWYCNDFYDALSWSVDHDPEFDPGIVNVDTTAEPNRGVDLFCRILERLKGVQNCLFIGNFLLHNRGKRHTVEELVKTIQKNPDYKTVGSALDWNPEQLLYRYDGAAANSTVMCSCMLWRK